MLHPRGRDHDGAGTGALAMTRRVVALFCWAFGVSVLLTWTRTLEQLAFGTVIALATAVALTTRQVVRRS